jgi:hypothetical protein
VRKPPLISAESLARTGSIFQTASLHARNRRRVSHAAAGAVRRRERSGRRPGLGLGRGWLVWVELGYGNVRSAE